MEIHNFITKKVQIDKQKLSFNRNHFNFKFTLGNQVDININFLDFTIHRIRNNKYNFNIYMK